MTMALGDLYDRFQRLITLDHRVQILEEKVQSILPRQEAISAALLRLDGRIETVKAETLTEFYRHAASSHSAPPPPLVPDRPALPSGRKPRRRR